MDFDKATQVKKVVSLFEEKRKSVLSDIASFLKKDKFFKGAVNDPSILQQDKNNFYVSFLAHYNILRTASSKALETE